MTKDDAIKAILAAGYEGSQGEAIVEISDAIEAIRALPDAGWGDIESDNPPHGKPVLLCWWHELFKEWAYEVAPYSTGKRYDNGYSSMSYHGSATHWVDIPPPPEKA